MAENSKIEWTTHTFNPWRGCTKVSAGCKMCYAETLSGRNPKTLGMWGPNGTRVIAAEAAWRQPLKWDKAAKAAGERHRVFCASLADVFEDWAGDMTGNDGKPLIANAWWPELGKGSSDRLTMDDVRWRLSSLIHRTPNLDWLLLTKRIERVEPMMRGIGGDWPSTLFPNVWLGTSVENQAAADQRIPHLLKTPAAVRFLSCEPLLRPVDLEPWLRGSTSMHVSLSVDGALRNRDFKGLTDDDGDPLTEKDAERELLKLQSEGVKLVPSSDCEGFSPQTGCPGHRNPGIDWVIVGGESGPGARPCRIEWIRSIVEQCEAAGVACFVKQLGSAPFSIRDKITHRGCAEKKPDGFYRYLNDKKGGDITEFPPDLRVREFPA